jgi:glucosylceramidase
VALEWNLANDPQYDPHTPGGCTECKGALTIDGNNISRNVSYYIIAHASKFVTPGSVRIKSITDIPLENVAFRRPDGKIVLIVLNDSKEKISFNIGYNGKIALTTLEERAVATFIWQAS